MTFQKTSLDVKGYDVATTLGLKPVSGDVGLEIEVEGKRLIHTGGMTVSPLLPPEWIYHQDGSLRGEENAEYVLRKPRPFDSIPGDVESLFDALAKNGAILDDSNRTSVHVHLNVQSFHLNRLTSLIGLYYIVEDVLTEWCGEFRVGNLFCLRASDAESVVTQTREFIQKGMKSKLRDGLHYAGLNIHALAKFGSLEFRTLRGVTRPDIIKRWVSILRRLYDLSKEYPDPRDICTGLSSIGPLAFFEKIFPDHASGILQDIAWNEQDLRESIYSGVRRAQDLCYCRDWENYNPFEIPPDPFGRSSATVLKKLATQVSAPPPIPPNVDTILWAINASGGVMTTEYIGAEAVPSDPEEDYPDPEDYDEDYEEEE